jgi:hypothetical protein
MDTPQKYMRIRPRGDTNAAFYAPAADITHGLKGVVKKCLESLCDKPVDKDHPLMGLAKNLAEFMKRSALSGNTWDKDGLVLVQNMFRGVDKKDIDNFLALFFAGVMDYYWHSMRLTTEAPELAPKEMEKAVGQSLTVRQMPPAMRKKYVEHIRTYNLYQQILDAGPLFVRLAEEPEEEKTDKEEK